MCSKRKEMFEIESIRGHKGKKYLVHWLNFDSSHNTWEPEKTLRADGVGHMIESYHALEALIIVSTELLLPTKKF